MLLIHEEVDRVGNEDTDYSFETKVEEHVLQSEVPVISDHQYWWSSKVRECASDRNIDEE